MMLVACPRCGAQFDVSSFAPGSTFICGACRNTLQVPAAASAPVVATPVAAPKAAPAAPKVAPAAAKHASSLPTAPVTKPPAAPAAAAPAALTKKPGVDRRRAGDAAPSAPSAPASRAERIRAQKAADAEGGGRKKSPVPLAAAGVGALLLLGGGLVFALNHGDGKKTDGAGGATGAQGGGAGAGGAAPGGGGPAARPAEKTFDQMDAQARTLYVQQKKKDAMRTAEGVKELHGWMVSKGLTEDAATLLKEGRGAFPNDPWLNEQMGLKNRAADIRKAASDDEVLLAVSEDDPDLLYVRELETRISKTPAAAWLSKEDSTKFDLAMVALNDAVTKMSDPVYQRTKQEFDNLRLNPAFIGMNFAFESFRPYVIFAESTSAEQKAFAEQVVQKTGESLTFAYGNWTRFMKEDLKLDPPPLEKVNDARLKLFVFRNRESFDQWHSRNQFANPGTSVAAYYSPGGNQFIFMHLNAFDRHVIMHEGTHQLIHFYARYFCEQDDNEIARKDGSPPERVQFEDNRLHSAFFWFQEGIAEYFGGLVKDKDPAQAWMLDDHLRNRAAHFAYMRSQKKHWAVEDFLFADQGQIYARAGVKSGGAGGDELRGLMYAQGWTMVQYLLHGDGGKWREKFCRMIRNELQGKTGKPYLLEAFGLPKRSDDPKVKAFLEELEKGYTRYADEMMKPK